MNRNEELYARRLKRKSRHHLKPVFIIDPRIAQHLTRFANKEEITKPNSQHSIYQKGHHTIYANILPVSVGCGMSKEVVRDSLETLFHVIIDLLKYHKNIDLAMGFCNIRMINRSMSYTFKDDLIREVKEPQFQHNTMSNQKPVNTHWTSSYESKWARTTLSTLIPKPDIYKQEI